MVLSSKASRGSPGGSRVGNFLLAVVCLVVVPMLPLGVEAAKHSWHIQEESYLLTAAVLAAGYIVSTAKPLFVAIYIIGFLGCMVIDYAPLQQEPPTLSYGSASVPNKGKHVPAKELGNSITSATPQLANPPPSSLGEGWTSSGSSLYRFIDWVLRHYALSGLCFVVISQTIERFSVHVLDDEPFPDWRKK